MGLPVALSASLTLRHENVGELQVPVQHILSMHVPEREQDLDEPAGQQQRMQLPQGSGSLAG